MECFLYDLRAFGIKDDHWTTAAQDEGEWRRTAEQGPEHFMAKWIAAGKARAELRHAVVCSNVTGRNKERTAQSKRVHARSPQLISYKWRELVSSRRMPCCLSLVLRLFCFVSSPLSVSFFVSVSSFFCFFGDVAFSEYFLYHYRFLFVWRVRRTFFPSGWCFSTL